MSTWFIGIQLSHFRLIAALYKPKRELGGAVMAGEISELWMLWQNRCQKVTLWHDSCVKFYLEHVGYMEHCVNLQAWEYLIRIRFQLSSENTIWTTDETQNFLSCHPDFMMYTNSRWPRSIADCPLFQTLVDPLSNHINSSYSSKGHCCGPKTKPSPPLYHHPSSP